MEAVPTLSPQPSRFMFLSLPTYLRYPNNSGPGPRPRSFSSLMILKYAKQRELQLSKEGIVIVHFASSFQHRPLHHSALCNIESLPVLPHHPTTDCSPQPTWLGQVVLSLETKGASDPKSFSRSALAGRHVHSVRSLREDAFTQQGLEALEKHLYRDGGVLPAQPAGLVGFLRRWRDTAAVTDACLSKPR